MAAIELLSDRAIQAALKAARASSQAATIQDGGGLSLIARANGVGWWRLRYWIASRENRLSLGTHPEISLADARQRRRDAQRLIAQGIDPSEKRKADSAARKVSEAAEKRQAAGLPEVGTFEHVAREWLSTIHAAKVSPGHAARTRIRLEQDVFPWLGRRPIVDVEAPELLVALRRVEERGAIETAHRIKDSCSQVFRYAIASGLCVRNPAADLRDALRPVESRHHAAIVDPKAVGALLRDMAEYKGNPVTRAALSLSALLLLRPGEVRQLEWADVDLDAALITIPAARMKGTKSEKAERSPHVVPLARQAVSILEDLKPLTSRSRYVFPALTSGQRCMSENTVRSALRRMGYANDEMTAHGFRAMARTMIAERLNIPAEVIEAQLGHAVPDALGRAYNRTQFRTARVEMMNSWADYLGAVGVYDQSAFELNC
jgi:integrase